MLLGCDRLLIPQAVADEIAAGPEDDPARRLLRSGFGEIYTLLPHPADSEIRALGAGEASVIYAAQQMPGAEAVLDDAVARECAKGRKIDVCGTLGVIVRAKQVGQVPAAAPLFTKLRDAGLFFSDDLAHQILAAIGESWPEP